MTGREVRGHLVHCTLARGPVVFGHGFLSAMGGAWGNVRLQGKKSGWAVSLNSSLLRV